jgi:hypothetical protein
MAIHCSISSLCHQQLNFLARIVKTNANVDLLMTYWVSAPCKLGGRRQPFVQTYCLHFLGWGQPVSPNCCHLPTSLHGKETQNNIIIIIITIIISQLWLWYSELWAELQTLIDRIVLILWSFIDDMSTTNIDSDGPLLTNPAPNLGGFMFDSRGKKGYKSWG